MNLAAIKTLEPAHKTAIVIALLVLLWMVSGVFKSADDVPAVERVVGAETVLPRVRVATLISVAHTPTIVLMGRTVAGQAVNVRSEIPGRVLEVVAVKGDTVVAGTVLVRIDPDDRTERLAEARARLKQQEIAYGSAQKLAKGGYSSKLNLAKSKADLEAARAFLTRMDRALLNADIVAPFDGVVDAIPVEAGDYMDKAGQVVARVLDLSVIKAVGQVAERDIMRVASGGTANIRLPDGRTLQGRVSFVGSSSNVLTRTFPVEVTVSVPGRDVPEGLTAEIILPMEDIVGHLISPALMTLDAKGQIGVKTVNEQGRVGFHAVRLESDTIGGAWLTGLPAEIRVITVGQEFVRVGDKVVAVPGELKTMHPSEGK